MAQIKELLPVVALGIATPEEVQLVKAALESDIALQTEYAELERVLTGLGADVSLAPPATLKSKVLAAARESIPKVVAPSMTAASGFALGLLRLESRASTMLFSPL